jgi:hypothetical protein
MLLAGITFIIGLFIGLVILIVGGTILLLVGGIAWAYLSDWLGWNSEEQTAPV